MGIEEALLTTLDAILRRRFHEELFFLWVLLGYAHQRLAQG